MRRAGLVVLLVLIGWIRANSESGIVSLTKDEQSRLYNDKRIECILQILNQSQTNSSEVTCPRIWDNVMCWPDSSPGIVLQSCPPYIHGLNTREFAERICLDNGTWWSRWGNDSSWTNYNRCMTKQPEQKDGVVNLVQRHQHGFRLMYNIGYVLSLVSLLCASVIIMAFQKLHCARNYIHLNLFVSFMLRALMSILRENLFVANLGFRKDVEMTVNGTYYFKDGPHWECRLFYTMYQYALMASYIWIFMEAIYLHMLIFVSVLTEQARIEWYMIIGWTTPLPFVISWAISRALLDNTLCWNTSTNSPGLTWINKIPVMITVVINFLFFINIVRLLFTKLSSNSVPSPDSARYRYRRLARSISVLIPIFGVYFLVFSFPMDNLSPLAKFVMLCFEMFFASYQGVFIAILLCFINSEVRSEMMKVWNRVNVRRYSTVSRASLPSNALQPNVHGGGACGDGGGAKDGMSSKNESSRKKYKIGRKSTTSVTDIEESVPFTNSAVKSYSIVGGDNPSAPLEMNVLTNQNGDAKTNEINLKIKFVNIEYQPRDGQSRKTTALDIETLRDGCTIKEENFLNNNTNKTTVSKDRDLVNHAESNSVPVSNDSTG